MTTKQTQHSDQRRPNKPTTMTHDDQTWPTIVTATPPPHHHVNPNQSIWIQPKSHQNPKSNQSESKIQPFESKKQKSIAKNQNKNPIGTQWVNSFKHSLLLTIVHTFFFFLFTFMCNKVCVTNPIVQVMENKMLGQFMYHVTNEWSNCQLKLWEVIMIFYFAKSLVP